MSSPAFTIQVPADADYRALAAEVAGRYVELLGASKPDCAALVRALTEQVEAMAASSGEQIELSCTQTAQGIEVAIRASGRVSIVHHPLAAGAS